MLSFSMYIVLFMWRFGADMTEAKLSLSFSLSSHLTCHDSEKYFIGTPPGCETSSKMSQKKNIGQQHTCHGNNWLVPEVVSGYITRLAARTTRESKSKRAPRRFGTPFTTQARLRNFSVSSTQTCRPMKGARVQSHAVIPAAMLSASPSLGTKSAHTEGPIHLIYCFALE